MFPGFSQSASDPLPPPTQITTFEKFSYSLEITIIDFLMVLKDKGKGEGTLWTPRVSIGHLDELYFMKNTIPYDQMTKSQ